MGLFLIAFLWLLSFAPLQGMAAPYAAMVIDARTGEVLHSRNADTRLHPASLTKMMTLYIAFEAVRNGEITLDTPVRITKKASSEPPSKLGLRTGQTIAFRYLIRAAAVKSANDAATAIGIALSGSEAAFARRMTRTAKSMGMSRTTFKNAHGLTESGHLSTARDMTTLGRHLLYDYPQYYNLFSRQSTHAGIKTVPNTNRRLLAAYKGADGIKTGYTRAAGFNLVASAKRKDERIIATVFGGKSGASRNAKVAELLDMGFRRAPSRAPIRKPARPSYAGNAGLGATVAALTIAPKSSLRPVLRPGPGAAVQVAGTVAETAAKNGTRIKDGIAAAIAAADIQPSNEGDAPRPAARPDDLVLASTDPAAQPEPEQEIVTRLSTSGGRLWGVNVGRYTTRYEAEKILLKTALSEMTTLEGTLRKVNQSSRGFDATFQGMTREQADLACRRLQARNVTCFMIGPS
ncbi:D-alanyl-D-alanine carboxypeptidase family protein [Ruegeria sp. Ofav3-42]|uniref:D-alanyl-D-alanine carboxypeptidase family protein n=1 Tax=Ruegeria sp. Ofav3-42 TaxID=2917759 RepID=UPI001EF71959|nr:D-alanyl-D-alanine carboxypeptidase family protein [Ruegeria sp. Ofav3-42]MCG7520047.1 D-alanyl-D-alanine carboxypeptidase [Ruegeria sp. Ofav3-42]